MNTKDLNRLEDAFQVDHTRRNGQWIISRMKTAHFLYRLPGLCTTLHQGWAPVSREAHVISSTPNLSSCMAI
jgi:hypothetical protein